MDNKIHYEELSTVDSDKWQWINKHYLKQLSLKRNEKEFKELKIKLNAIVDERVKKLAEKKDDEQDIDGSISRRSSRLLTKKRNNYNEESENYNLYLLLELINYESTESHNSAKIIEPNEHKTAFKRVKTGENMEETKIDERLPSKVFSNESFGGKNKRSKSKLQNTQLDAILQNNNSPEGSDSDSLDMNIGK